MLVHFKLFFRASPVLLNSQLCNALASCSGVFGNFPSFRTLSSPQNEMHKKKEKKIFSSISLRQLWLWKWPWRGKHTIENYAIILLGYFFKAVFQKLYDNVFMDWIFPGIFDNTLKRHFVSCLFYAHIIRLS